MQCGDVMHVNDDIFFDAHRLKIRVRLENYLFTELRSFQKDDLSSVRAFVYSCKFN